MTFKLRSSGPFKMMGSSPAKHKMEAHPTYHGAGGIGWVDEVTAEQVKAHDDKYGEGHSDSHTATHAIGKGAAEAGAAVKTAKAASRGVIKAAEEAKKKSPAKHYTGVHKGAKDHPAHKVEDFLPNINTPINIVKTYGGIGGKIVEGAYDLITGKKKKTTTGAKSWRGGIKHVIKAVKKKAVKKKGE